MPGIARATAMHETRRATAVVNVMNGSSVG
jgi:hypothetical protein